MELFYPLKLERIVGHGQNSSGGARQQKSTSLLLISATRPSNTATMASPRNTHLADCAVCMEDYVAGPSNRCNKCSEENKGLMVGVPTMLMFLTLLATVLVASYLLEVVRDGADVEHNQPRQWWRANVWRLRTFLSKALPLSTTKIVVTVLQIVIQVRPVIDGSNPIYLGMYQTIFSDYFVRRGDTDLYKLCDILRTAYV